MYFLSFILSNYFHISLAVLLCYRSPLVFSLGCPYHPFTLHYQAMLLLRKTSCPWAITTTGSSFHRIFQVSYNFKLPLELLLVRSPLLKKSKFVSSPVLTDMLKSRTYSCMSASFQPHALQHAYRILYVGLRQRNLSIPYMSSSPICVSYSYSPQARSKPPVARPHKL